MEMTRYSRSLWVQRTVYLEHKVLCEQCCKTSRYPSPGTWERFSLGYPEIELMGHKVYECSTSQDDGKLFQSGGTNLYSYYITTSNI